MARAAGTSAAKPAASAVLTRTISMPELFEAATAHDTRAHTRAKQAESGTDDSDVRPDTMARGVDTSSAPGPTGHVRIKVRYLAMDLEPHRPAAMPARLADALLLRSTARIRGSGRVRLPGTMQKSAGGTLMPRNMSMPALARSSQLPVLGESDADGRMAGRNVTSAGAPAEPGAQQLATASGGAVGAAVAPRASADIELLHNLLEHTKRAATSANTPTAAEDVDIVVSGGGLKGYFVTGAAAVLASTPHLRPVRFAGASAGAWCAAFMACELDTMAWVNTFHSTRMHMADGKHILEAYKCFANDILPADAHLRCNGRVFISVSVLTWTGLRNLIVSEFLSREDLIAACIASSNIPFITARGFGDRFRGHVAFDGGPTNNTPVFTDGARRQIVFRLGEVPYSISSSVSPTDPCIEALVLRGAMQMSRFCADGNMAPASSVPGMPAPSSSDDTVAAISWLDPASVAPDTEEADDAHAATATGTATAVDRAPHRTPWFLVLRKLGLDLDSIDEEDDAGHRRRFRRRLVAVLLLLATLSGSRLFGAAVLRRLHRATRPYRLGRYTGAQPAKWVFVSAVLCLVLTLAKR